MLEQKISTHFQQFWLSKLLGFDYEIQYNKVVNNVVDDALSRVQGAEVLCMAITVISSDLEDQIKNSYSSDTFLTDVNMKLQEGELVDHFILKNGLSRKHGKIVIGSDAALRTSILCWHHYTPERGHLVGTLL